MAIRKPGIDGTFLFCLVMNMVLTFQWTIPAWILLACHFAFGISIWWFVGALGIWLLLVILIIVAMMLAGRLPRESSPSVLPDKDKREEIMRKSRAVADKDKMREDIL